MTVEQGTQLGRYRLDALLGAGGMAEVWKATLSGPAGFSSTFVVKRVLSHLARDPAFVKMFLAEAKLSALLTHPNIVQVFELAQDGNEFYMAMEYVDGCDLGLLLRRGEPLPVGFAVYVIQSVCRALGYAHALCDRDGTPLQLVHRDVTPSNIMLGREGSVKLLDFGIAKALGAASEHRTETGTLKGKLGYMSPEHVEGRPLDHRSDLFAAGVVLHELLTGRRLFKAASDFLTLSAMREAKVEPPSRINPAVPPALDTVVLAALARDPAARYPTADDFVTALEPFLDGWNADRMRRFITDVLAARALARSANSAVTMTAEPAIAAPLAADPPLAAGPPLARRRRWPLALAAIAALALGGVGVYAAVSRSEPAVAASTPSPTATSPSPSSSSTSPSSTSPSSTSPSSTSPSSTSPSPTTTPQAPPSSPALTASPPSPSSSSTSPSSTSPSSTSPSSTSPSPSSTSPSSASPSSTSPSRAAEPTSTSSGSTRKRRPRPTPTKKRPSPTTTKPAFDPESALP